MGLWSAMEACGEDLRRICTQTDQTPPEFALSAVGILSAAAPPLKPFPDKYMSTAQQKRPFDEWTLKVRLDALYTGRGRRVAFGDRIYGFGLVLP